MEGRCEAGLDPFAVSAYVDSSGCPPCRNRCDTAACSWFIVAFAWDFQLPGC